MNFIESLTDPAVKSQDLENVGRKIMKIKETCTKFREESDFHHPGAPK